MSILYWFFAWWYGLGWPRHIQVGNRKRTYFCFLPPQIKNQPTPPTQKWPVVIALHGSLINGPAMAWFSQLNRQAKQSSFIAVYPDGTGPGRSYFWNAGNCCGWAMKNQIDDVGFLTTLVEKLCQSYPIDPKRIYFTGLSNGAMMTYRIAAELSDRIAAIAPVAGPMLPLPKSPQFPVPVIHFHGTQDEYTPYSGGIGSKSPSKTDFLSVDQTINHWVGFNGCDPTPKIESVPTPPGDLAVTRFTYPNGNQGSQVVLIKIDGGGHTWPGRRPPTKILGKSVEGISANQMMWDFFERHPKA